jgi:hypothetical protein
MSNPKFLLPSNMAAKSVEFHEEAAREFLAAIDWYFLRNEIVASRFALEVTGAVRLISEAPQRWPRYSRDTRNSFFDASLF